MAIYVIPLMLSLLILLVFIYLYLKQRSYLYKVVCKLEELNLENENIKIQRNNLELKHAVLEARYEDEIKSSKEKMEVLQSAKEELSKEFKTLANQIFEDKSKHFNHTHKEQFETLLKPFREQISNFSTQSREQFNLESKDRHLLKDELLRLKEMNHQLSQDALNLTNALKGENKTQGDWGEIILERILEESGLRDGVEYVTQASLKSDDGKTYRPDVIIHMPESRDIVVDSKVSLVAYERYISSDNEESKAYALKEHLNSISAHIRGLSEKKYEKLNGVNSLDFVLLFMPIEGSFLLALQEDGEFFKRAFENNILVVSPSTLMVTLRTIEHIWRIQKQQDNADKIAQEAEAMYEKLVMFVEEMQSIGTHLGRTHDSYEKAMNRLKSGRGNLIKRAENMKELGLKPKKNLPLRSED